MSATVTPVPLVADVHCPMCQMLVRPLHQYTYEWEHYHCQCGAHFAIHSGSCAYLHSGKK